MLKKIHKSHQGADSSIRRAREVLFWPGMSSSIRQISEACGICAQYQTEQPKEPMKSHDIPELPWSRISVDLCQLKGKDYLIMVDHYSDFIEVEHLNNTTARNVIKVMKRNFARYGIPNECVSDNGPQFVSLEYKVFAKEYGFTATKSSPYYSRGNGKAEAAVKVVKNILKKSGQEDPYLALLAYRNTPQKGYVYSPAERLMSRKLRDIIPMLPSQLQPKLVDRKVVTEDIMRRRTQSKIQYDKRASRPLRNPEIDNHVYFKPKEKNMPWIYGKVVGRPDERSCVMGTPHGLFRRNRKHIRKVKVENPERLDQELEMISLPESSSEDVSDGNNMGSGEEQRNVSNDVEERSNSQNSCSDDVQTENVLRRSERVRRPPLRYQDYILG